MNPFTRLVFSTHLHHHMSQNQRLCEAWNRSQLNPTYTRRISLLSTPRPQVDNNDILLVVGYNYNIMNSYIVHTVASKFLNHLLILYYWLKSYNFRSKNTELEKMNCLQKDWGIGQLQFKYKLGASLCIYIVTITKHGKLHMYVYNTCSDLLL